MIQVCVMGGHEGRLRPEKKVYFTLMGGLELTKPTIAKQILSKRSQQKSGPGGNVQSEFHLFITIMGATEIRVPTMTEEFLDLRELVRGGVLSLEECERYLSEMHRADLAVSAFTLMGGFEESVLPSEESEIESLALQRHLGSISERAQQILQTGIGRRDAERWVAVRQAVQASAGARPNDGLANVT
ncbi:MAG: hypothetical protein AABZ47_06435 [Planctomycetota bacterium]